MLLALQQVEEDAFKAEQRCFWFWRFLWGVRCKLEHYYCTDSIDLDTSYKADSHSAGQEIPHHLWNLKVHKSFMLYYIFLATLIQSTLNTFFKIILKLFLIYVIFPSGLISLDIWTEMPKVFLVCSVVAVCPTHHSLLHRPIWMMLDEEYDLHKAVLFAVNMKWHHTKGQKKLVLGNRDAESDLVWCSFLG
jgi:hypothetical protein